MKIGIIGGGQLARMMMEASYKLGFEFVVLSNEKNSPAGKITNSEIAGDWNNTECLKIFAEACDVITLENEFIEQELRNDVMQKSNDAILKLRDNIIKPPKTSTKTK